MIYYHKDSLVKLALETGHFFYCLIGALTFPKPKTTIGHTIQ